jgi:hypothetical protein
MTKKFEPTDEQRELVELLVSIGTTQENICQVIKRPTLVSKNGDSLRVKVMVPIDQKTLRRAFREEIATAQSRRTLRWAEPCSRWQPPASTQR